MVWDKNRTSSPRVFLLMHMFAPYVPGEAAAGTNPSAMWPCGMNGMGQLLGPLASLSQRRLPVRELAGIQSLRRSLLLGKNEEVYLRSES